MLSCKSCPTTWNGSSPDCLSRRATSRLKSTRDTPPISQALPTFTGPSVTCWTACGVVESCGSSCLRLAVDRCGHCLRDALIGLVFQGIYELGGIAVDT